MQKYFLKFVMKCHLKILIEYLQLIKLLNAKDYENFMAREELIQNPEYEQFP